MYDTINKAEFWVGFKGIYIKTVQQSMSSLFFGGGCLYLNTLAEKLTIRESA